MDEHTEANRRTWNERARVHPETDYYDVEGFLAGDSSLYDIERDELADVVDADTDLLHLMCHFGLDTLSWAREVGSATGVDFSPDALELARDLADEASIENATFEQGDVLDLALHTEFDVVFNTFGVLAWLSDLDAWADTIARHLRSGGVFYLADVHPFAGAMTLDGATATFDFPYFPRDDPVEFDVAGSYADTDGDYRAGKQYQYPHSLGETVTALCDAGLRIEFLHEYPWADFPMYDCLVEDADGTWRFPEELDVEIPLTFSLRATRA